MVQISKEGELTISWGWDRQDKETAIKPLLRAWQVITESAKLQWLGIAKEKLKEVSSNSRSGRGKSLIKRLLAMDLISCLGGGGGGKPAGSEETRGREGQGRGPREVIQQRGCLGL